MAKRIEKIINYVTLALNEQRRGRVKIDDKITALQAASDSLFADLLKRYRETGIVPDQLHPFKKRKAITFTSGEADLATLAPDFSEIVALSATVQSEQYPAIISKNDQEFISRDLAMLFSNPQDPNSISDFNKLSVDIDQTTIGEVSGIELPSNFIKPLAVYLTDSNGNLYEANLVSPDVYFSNDQATNLAEGDLFQAKEHLKKKATISLTTGVGNLPSDFVKDKGTFLSGTDEGIILDIEEYSDRLDSVLVPPEAENPIAYLRDNQIEVSPNTLTTIDLVYYSSVSEQRPMVTIFNGQLLARGNNATGTGKLIYLAHPVDRRPIVKVGKDEIDTLVVLIEPSSITAGFIYYIKTPADFTYDYTASGRTITYNDGASTDTEWGESAVDDLVDRTLMFLGAQIQNKDAVSLGMAKTQLANADTKEYIPTSK